MYFIILIIVFLCIGFFFFYINKNQVKYNPKDESFKVTDIDIMYQLIDQQFLNSTYKTDEGIIYETSLQEAKMYYLYKKLNMLLKKDVVYISSEFEIFFKE